ncbi:heat shock 70 kDa protein 15-like isoform X1 [Iris pallida]|uniref:Heat shock 70 kDa protein 15-like isoform X1 n=1 Tax=Iris pallida TaxID=29817 RepID=A0AAX6GYI6_IRIPA|nr:heat shock 70 kDa protein 15-like isoform X1 [Iris pallida]
MDDAMIVRPYPLRLFHETTTTALAYGIYKIYLPENDLVKVAFVNVDHASMQCLLDSSVTCSMHLLPILNKRDANGLWIWIFDIEELALDLNEKIRF